MSEKRRGLGRGLGALIPDQAGRAPGGARPVDVFFRDQEKPAGSVRPEVATMPNTAAAKAVVDVAERAAAAVSAPVSRETDRDVVSATEGAAPIEPLETPGDHGAEAGEAGEAAEVGTDEAAALTPVPGASYAEVPLDAIRPNPQQPRTVFDEDDMSELVHSIREIGVLQPIVLRRVADGTDGVEFELIMGERRWRASRAAGKERVPAIIKATDDDVMLRDALLENLHRSQLNVLEEAAAYQQLLDDFGCTQEELARRIGRSRPQISNTIRLLRLPPLVARRVAAGVLSAGHARALLTLEDGAQMERLAQRIVAEGLSVRSVEEIVAVGMAPEKARRQAPRPGARHPQLDDIASRLSDRFDTRAKLSLGARKGRLTIEFASVEDLHRILGEMGVETE